VPLLARIVAPETAGDPMSAQRWVRSSLRTLSGRLHAAGHGVSPPTVGRLLTKLGYALHVNAKRIEARAGHPDRDAQFAYIAEQRHAFADAGRPILSVDTKKKELIGNFKNAGRTWSQEAEAVNVHDFLGDALGRAVPYGVDDLTHNRGTIYVGSSGDTAALAVDAIVRWWDTAGRACGVCEFDRDPSGGAPRVLMDQAIHAIAAHDLSDDRRRPAGRSRRVQGESPVGSGRVVVVDVLVQDPLEVALAEDEHPVQAFPADGADPPLGMRAGARRLERRPHHAHALGAEDVVERARELRIPIPDQHRRSHARPLERPDQVAGLLGHPGCGWVGGAAGEEHAPGLDVDEEERVEDV
jgi:Rhodopirellula transposase DDE domain